MEAPVTKANRALASAVNSRISADAQMLNAKAALWRFGGLGALCALIGVGIGAAFFGYSYVNDSGASADKMATAFVKALESTTLKTAGEVGIKPDAQVSLTTANAEVKLDTSEAVRLDTSNTSVRLDPQSEVKVRAVVDGDIPRPTPSQLGPSRLPNTKSTVVTNYTVFKHVALPTKGTVVTGWVFTSSEQAAPSHEYCYYSDTIKDGVNLTIDLAVNGAMLEKIKNMSGIDGPSAAANCVWFNGSSTVVARTY